MSEDRLSEEARTDTRTDEAFLSRWSRRKQAAAEPSPLENPPIEHAPDAVPELTDADMPPIESLDENADYRGFLSPKVSEALRQQALQKLFSSACFNVCDGLDDYADDFTQFEKLGDVMTADLRHRLQQEAEKAAERVQAEANGQTQGVAEETAQAVPPDDSDLGEVTKASRRDGNETLQEDSEEGLS